MRMYADGALYREISERLGISYGMARDATIRVMGEILALSAVREIVNAADPRHEINKTDAQRSAWKMAIDALEASAMPEPPPASWFMIVER